MNKGRLLFHNAKAVWLSDYTGLSGDEYIQDVNDTGNAYLKHCEGTGVDHLSCLLDFTNSRVTPKVIEALRENSLKINKYCDKLGTLGVPTFLNMFVSTISLLSGMSIKAFSTREDAMEWLTG